VPIESWFVLALGSAFCLASADAVAKKFMAGYSGEELVLVRVGFTALILGPFCLLNPLPEVPAEFWMWVGLCVPLEILAVLLYMLAIRDSPLYLTLPYLALTPVFNVLTGWVFLGEAVSLKGMVGILFVVIGTALLNMGSPGPEGQGENAADRPDSVLKLIGWSLARERGSQFMLVAAFIYSVTSVMSKQAMSFATPESFGPIYALSNGVCLVIFCGVRNPTSLRVFTRRPALHLFAGGLIAIMVATHFLALAQVEVAYMITIKRTSLLFGLIYGWILFGEHHLRQHLFSGVLIVIGVALILL
jgi:drug/metabolite transporter (DMT)-like permease